MSFVKKIEIAYGRQNGFWYLIQRFASILMDENWIKYSSHLDLYSSVTLTVISARTWIFRPVAPFGCMGSFLGPKQIKHLKKLLNLNSSENIFTKILLCRPPIENTKILFDSKFIKYLVALLTVKWDWFFWWWHLHSGLKFLFWICKLD